MKKIPPSLVDFAERTGATFAQAFLALSVVTGLSDLHMLYAALAAGGLAAGKFVLVKANAYLGTSPAVKPPAGQNLSS